MKAAICIGYGGPEVVKVVDDVPTPVPKAGEVLVRVLATTVSSADARIRGSRFPAGLWFPARLVLGITRPRNSILGTELAGVVEAVGPGASRFRPGDEVIAFAGSDLGCHAEFRTFPEKGAITAKPKGLDVAEAACLCFGGATALYFLRDVAGVKPGERVLINGASGAVGSAAVQLGRHMGAHVTAVCSAARRELVLTLGAHEAIDYAVTDFAESGQRWDVIVDVVGNASFARCRRALSANGRLLLLAAGLGEMAVAPFQSARSGLRVRAGPAPDRAQDIEDLKVLFETGAYRPVIGARFALADISKAHALVDGGHKAGSAVISMPQA